MSAYSIIAFGRTAEIIAYDKQHVLKLFKHDFPLNLIVSEFNNAKAVYDLGIHSPNPVEIIEFGERHGIVYSRIDGNTMLRTITENPLIVIEEAHRLASMHIEIHKRQVETFPNQKHLLAERIKDAPILTTQEKARILKKLIELPDDNKLCHGDFHPDNIIHSEGTDWVIDWMTGVQGSPASDVARTYLLLKFGHVSDEVPKEIQAFITKIRDQIIENYLEEYFRKSFLSMNEINDWIIPIAAARLCEWIPYEEKTELVKLIRDVL
ncbi:aminoglycoside phosphotransferase family protein [Paenibacillus sp. KN14-4R]|uniref:aminoglycoside phosphotransferase family protein n=1 Tax=Paenibacillus sp. KN14-4R TaxID=3445773 RepID=UPI003FA014A6